MGVQVRDDVDPSRCSSRPASVFVDRVSFRAASDGEFGLESLADPDDSAASAHRGRSGPWPAFARRSRSEPRVPYDVSATLVDESAIGVRGNRADGSGGRKRSLLASRVPPQRGQQIGAAGAIGDVSVPSAGAGGRGAIVASNDIVAASSRLRHSVSRSFRCPCPSRP